MLSGNDIRAFQLAATLRAARQRRVPYVHDGRTEAAMIGTGREEFRLPFLGTFVPYGWEPALRDDGYQRTYLVDSSGFGRPDEPALTLAQFASLLRDGAGYGIIEAGEFQVVVGEYERVRI